MGDTDYFAIYYKIKKALFKIFIKELAELGGRKTAKQHCRQVQTVWGILDKKHVLANKYALQDLYHHPLLLQIGNGGVDHVIRH